MSYIRSLRFKLMLLCVVPLLSCAFLFIGHSVVIAFQVREAATDTYLAVAQHEDIPPAALQAFEKASVDIGWITRQWIVVFCFLFVCFYIPITINIGRFIKPIRELAACSDRLAAGDISVNIDKNRTDEIGTLQGSFLNLISTSKAQAGLIQKIADSDISGDYSPRSDADVVGHSIVRMLENDNSMMSELSSATSQISAVSRQIAVGSQSLASGSTEQAAAIEELSSTVKEVEKIPQESLKLAKRGADLADTVKSYAENGNKLMTDMVAAVGEIREASLGIQKVIKVIDDIAFQTNILALNAAVEAARAGQHGKGFAVVADEVRNLANKSAEAAKDTGALIVDSMQKSDLGVNIANETYAAIAQIVEGINKSSEILEEIATLSMSQDVTITGIGESLRQMTNVVQSNSAMAEEYAASSEQMNGQALTILDMVSRFKLKPTMREAHGGATAE